MSFEEFRRVVDQAPDWERVILQGLSEPLLEWTYQGKPLVA